MGEPSQEKHQLDLILGGPPPKKQKVNSSEMCCIKFGTGDSATTFTAPKRILAKSSEVLISLLGALENGTREGPIELPRVHPGAVETYLRFLQTDKLEINKQSNDQRKDSASDETARLSAKTHHMMLALAHLGQQLSDAALSNAVNDAFIADFYRTQLFPDPTWYHHLVENFLPHSKFYQLNVDFLAIAGRASGFQNRGSELPARFVLDVLIEVIRRRGEPLNAVLWKTRCLYHEHDDNLAPRELGKCTDETSTYGFGGSE